MSRRLYVPFDVFAMQEDVSVSTLVRDGSLGWTCGQCPLDREGHVVAPNDLMAQAMVLCEGQAHGLVAAELAFARQDVSVGEARHRSKEGRLCVRDDGVQRFVTGIHADPQGDLVSQTSAIMSRISEDLESADMSFANVVKLTAHYVGGASAEELHGNMKVRHRHYRKPGPASTGLPVASLLDKDCRIAIAVMAVR